MGDISMLDMVPTTSNFGIFGNFSCTNSGTPIKTATCTTLTTPTSISFKFTPKITGQPVYPSLEKMKCSPFLEQSNQQLKPGFEKVEQELLQKGYSKKLSNSVLEELNSRAEKISSRLSFSPRFHNALPRISRRFSGKHRSRFSKMDSITAHYAATRTRTSTSKPTLETKMKRLEVESENNRPDDFTPGKRNPQTSLSSTSKRRRTLVGPEEVPQGPSKSEDENKENSQSYSDDLVKNIPTKVDPKGSPIPKITNPRSLSSRALKDCNSNHSSRFGRASAASPNKQTRSTSSSFSRKLSNKSSIPTLSPKKTTNGPSSSHTPATLMHKSSIPTLPRVAAIRSLEKKGSCPSLSSSISSATSVVTSLSTSSFSRSSSSSSSLASSTISKQMENHERIQNRIFGDRSLSHETSNTLVNPNRSLKTKQSMPLINSSRRKLSTKSSLPSLPSGRSLNNYTNTLQSSTVIPRSTSTKFSTTKPSNASKCSRIRASPSLNKIAKDKPIWR